MSPRELLVMISSMIALTALGIDLMLPAFDEIRVAFDLGDASNETGKIVTVFFLGLAVAQLVYGPLADRFGRKPVLYLGIAIYVLGAIGSALAPSFNVLLISRFVWGVGAAGTRVVATAIVRDRFLGNAMAKAMSQIMAVFVLVPVIAPTIGAGIVAVLPWQMVFWSCVVAAAVVSLWSLRLRETLHPDFVQPLGFASSLAIYRKVARTPITSGYTIATVFLQGVMTAYLASVELIIGDVMDHRSQFPFIFGGVAASFGVAAVANGRLVEKLGIDRIVRNAFAAILSLGVVLIVVCLAGNGRPSIWVFMPILGLMLGSFMFLMPNLGAASMEPVGNMAGSASALTGAVRIAGGAALGTVASGLIDNSVTSFTMALVAMCAAAAFTVAVVNRRNAEVVVPALAPV